MVETKTELKGLELVKSEPESQKDDGNVVFILQESKQLEQG